MTTTPALEVLGLDLRLGATQVLKGVSLQVAAGERLAVIGPNGAGKSSLFNAISGQARPSGGQVRLFGQAVGGWSPQRIQRLGLARSFQISQLFPTLSVHDHLRCAACRSTGQGYRFWRLLSRQRGLNQRADEWLQRLGLMARAEVPASALSYAEQRTLDIGMALIGDAPVLLLDEPTAGMSRSETDRFMQLLDEVTRGRTLLLVEHDMGVVFHLAQRIAVLAHGGLLACGTPESVRADPRVQQAYLGQGVLP